MGGESPIASPGAVMFMMGARLWHFLAAPLPALVVVVQVPRLSKPESVIMLIVGWLGG